MGDESREEVEGNSKLFSLYLQAHEVWNFFPEGRQLHHEVAFPDPHFCKHLLCLVAPVSQSQLAEQLATFLGCHSCLVDSEHTNTF